MGLSSCIPGFQELEMLFRCFVSLPVLLLLHHCLVQADGEGRLQRGCLDHVHQPVLLGKVKRVERMKSFQEKGSAETNKSQLFSSIF